VQGGDKKPLTTAQNCSNAVFDKSSFIYSSHGSVDESPVDA